MSSTLQINQSLSIPLSELRFTFSCGTGPGGQHVNKVSTRVTLWFDISKSNGLSQGQKEIIREKLSSRINKNGVLRLVSYRHRSQMANKTAVIEKFQSLMGSALVKKKRRTKTTVPKVEKVKRIANKKLRSRLKTTRKKAGDDM
jgi:ribosome-associated protein